MTMSPLGTAADLAGLVLLAAASAIAATRIRTGPRPALVEDRVPRPAPLELEEAVGPGDHQDAVP
jgi:hypothetical protein